MSIAYGIIALISLCMVGICVWQDKKRDVWLLLVFVSVSICNLGYFMLSISHNLGDALNSNRLAYLGSVFLPFFMLMMVLRFCKIKQSKSLKVSLITLGLVMLAITTSPGILPIYYSTVDIEFVNGTTKLIRDYGPLHLLYYLYLFGYMISMIVITITSIAKHKIKSKGHTILLLCIVFCNIAIWLVEQFLPRGFEWLSVSYIITECLILIIYSSMQRQGLMSTAERTQTYTINVLLAVYLLLFANFVRVASNNTTEIMYVISQIVVLTIYVGILVSWGASVYNRIINKNVRRYMISLVGMMILWMLMRTLRHTVFYHVYPFGQWCWYAYYISMILIPVLCYFAAKHVGKPEDYRMSNKWRLLYLPSAFLITGILTNDIHQLAFRFNMGYEVGWEIYQRSILYYIATVWIFICIIMMIGELIRSCHIPGKKKVIWFPIAMLGIGVSYSVLYATDTPLFSFIEMTAALCFTVVAIWESSIKTGLIQSNGHYEELLANSGLGVTVIDNNYDVYYRSDDAISLSKKQVGKVKGNPMILESGARISSSAIKGGYVLWQEDLSELLDVLEELEELREELKGSNAVSMQNYKINKQIHILAEKNRIHDEIHRQTAHQIGLLNDYLVELMTVKDPDEKRKLLCRIVVIGAYLKRRDNLILVGEQDGYIKEEELNLSVKEVMKNLELAGVNCASSLQFSTNVQTPKGLPGGVVMRLFDFYEYVVENAIDDLEYLLVRFFDREGDFYCCADAVCGKDLTCLENDEIKVSVLDSNEEYKGNYYTLSFMMKGGNSK